MRCLPSPVEAMGLIEEGVGFFVWTYPRWSGRPVVFLIKVHHETLPARAKRVASEESPFPEAGYGSSTGTARASVFFLKSIMSVVT